MNRHEAQRLLDRIQVVRTSCDLDLLIFFARHPQTLLTSDQLSVFIGYDLAQVSRSLDVLIAAGLLTRAQNPAHAARMYVLTPAGPNGGWLTPFHRLASTRQGRLALKEALSRRPTQGTGGPATPKGRIGMARTG